MWSPCKSQAVPGAGPPKQWVSVQRQLIPKSKKQSIPRKHPAPYTQLSYLKVLNSDLISDYQRKNGFIEDPKEPLELASIQKIDVRGYYVHRIDEDTMLSCTRLRLCNLSGCYVKDIGAFYGSINLLKLDLSDNRISHLPPAEFWGSLISLQVLYLSGNALSEKADLLHLNGCPQLHVLTIHSTPLTLTPNYRHHVVNSVFSLKALDQHVISDQEIIENMLVTENFRALSPAFKLPLHVTVKPGAGVKEELSVVFRLLLAVDNVLAKHSPVIMVQRWVRGWLARKVLLKRANTKIRDLVTRNMGKLTQRRQTRDSVQGKRSYILHKPPELMVTPPLEPGYEVSPPSDDTPFPRRYLGLMELHNLPPPPPSSPRIAATMETHVAGVDSKLRCSMHINMDTLQRSIEQSDKETRRVLFAKTRNPRKEKAMLLRVPSVTTKAADTRTEPSRARDATRTHDGQHSRTWDDRDAMETKELGGGEQCSEEITMTGRPLGVKTYQASTRLASSNREEGNKIRQAIREINKCRLELKQTPVKKTELKSKPDAMSKDEFMFTRVHGTMNLSLLNKMDGIHQAHKFSKDRTEKASLVARVRRERVTRKNKIEAFQNQLKERVHVWKGRQEELLEQRREELELQREAELLEQCRQRERRHLSGQKQHEDREMATNFRQNSTLITKTLSAEDRKVACEEDSISAQEKVRQVRQEVLDQQEEARRYLELRRNKLLQEGRQDKQEIDARMLELASQRLLDVKQRIAREATRKETARAAIATAKEEVRAWPRGLGMPTQQDHGVHMEDSYSTFTRKSSEFKSPSHKRSQVKSGQYDTWQRGVKAVDINKRFPSIDSTEDFSPLMYQMMVPHLPARKRTDTPLTPFTELESSTSSIARPHLQISTG